jgi:hypothetical protein
MTNSAIEIMSDEHAPEEITALYVNERHKLIAAMLDGGDGGIVVTGPVSLTTDAEITELNEADGWICVWRDDA